jgi:hypothetical protein
MFEWFKNIGRREYPTWADVPPPSDMEKIGEDMSKVVPFPELKAVPPKEEKPAMTYYRLGMTNNNRVSFAMGYSEITLNAGGIDNLIKQLELFRDQLQEENDE